jgi:hypothetical protein
LRERTDVLAVTDTITAQEGNMAGNNNGAGIDIKEVFTAADSLRQKGRKVTVDNVQDELKLIFSSKGNRNLVLKHLQAWRRDSGIEARKTAVKAPLKKVADSGDHSGSLDRLPAIIRQPVIALIMAIHAIIGMIRNEERGAATELVDNAKLQFSEEMDNLRAELSSLLEENQRLHAENLLLKNESAHKHDDNPAHGAADLMQQFSDFLRSGAAAKTNVASKQASGGVAADGHAEAPAAKGARKARAKRS